MFSPDRFYSVPEVCKGSRAPREMVYADLEAGRLKALRRGRRWLIPGASVLRWLEELSS